VRGSGSGIIGMTEDAQALGGTLTAARDQAAVSGCRPTCLSRRTHDPAGARRCALAGDWDGLFGPLPDGLIWPRLTGWSGCCDGLKWPPFSGRRLQRDGLVVAGLRAGWLV